MNAPPSQGDKHVNKTCGARGGEEWGAHTHTHVCTPPDAALRAVLVAAHTLLPAGRPALSS